MVVLDDSTEVEYPSLQELWLSAFFGSGLMPSMDKVMKQLEERYSFLDETIGAHLKSLWIHDLVLQYRAAERWRLVFKRLAALSLVVSIIASAMLFTPFSELFGVIMVPMGLCLGYALLSVYDRLQSILIFSEEMVSKLDNLCHCAESHQLFGDLDLSLSRWNLYE